jgi:hypothetical protein
MNLEDALEHCKRCFDKRIETHRPVSQGVDYNGSDAQSLRIEQLVKVIDPNQPFNLLGFGRRYGGLLTSCKRKAGNSATTAMTCWRT